MVSVHYDNSLDQGNKKPCNVDLNRPFQTRVGSQVQHNLEQIVQVNDSTMLCQ